MKSDELSALGWSFGTHRYTPYLLGGMLVAEGGRAKDLLFGAEPNRNNLKKSSGFIITQRSSLLNDRQASCMQNALELTDASTL
jgi:hypothetical protein